MTNPGGTYFIVFRDMNGKYRRIVNDENGHVFRSKEVAEFYAKEKGIEAYDIIDAETYGNLVQAAMANRRQ